MTMSTNVPQTNYTRQRKMNDGSIKPIVKDRYDVKLDGTVICKITVCDFNTGVLNPIPYLKGLGVGVASLVLENTDRNVLVKRVKGTNNVERKFFINGKDNQRLTVEDIQEDLLPIFANEGFTVHKVKSPDQIEREDQDELLKEIEAIQLAEDLEEEEADDITKDEIPF